MTAFGRRSVDAVPAPDAGTHAEQEECKMNTTLTTPLRLAQHYDLTRCTQ